MSLEKALSEVRAGRWDQALDRLLEVFRKTKHPAVAELVTRVSEQAEKGLPAIAGKNLDAKKDTAIALIEKGEAKDLPRVLRLFRELRMAQAKELVEALGDVPADPRFLDAVVPLLRDPPFSSSTSMPFWRSFVALADAQGDPRTRPALAALDFSWLPEWSAESFRSVCTRLSKKKDAPVATAIDEALVDEIRGALGGNQKDGSALLAAIHADPTDDAARAVWADWLQERDDPRGRFVALQLLEAPTEEQRKAIRTLLGAHGDEWLGDLAGVIDLERVRFRRGFLADIHHWPTDELTRLVESEHARTIEWLYLSEREQFPAELLRDPRFEALRFVGGIEPTMLDAIEAAGPFPFTGLGIDLYDAIPGGEDTWTDAQRAVLRRVYGLRKTFPNLTTLAVRAWYKKPETLDDLWESPLCEGIAALHISGAGSDAGWFRRREKLPKSVKLLEVSFDYGFHDWATEFHMGDEGVRMIATLRPKLQNFAGNKLEDLVEELDELPTDVLTELEVYVDGARATKTGADAIAEAAGRHTRLRRLVLPGREAAAPAKATGAKTAKERANDAFVEQAKIALAAVAARVEGPFDIADASSPQSLERLRALLPAKGGDARAVELALAILALPTPPNPERDYYEPRRELATAAFLVLADGGCSDPFTRVMPTLGNTLWSFARVLPQRHSLIGQSELETFLDWFDALSVHDTSSIYYAVKDILLARSSPALRADVKRRLAEKKLNRFHRWMYEEVLRGD